MLFDLRKPSPTIYSLLVILAVTLSTSTYSAAGDETGVDQAISPTTLGSWSLEDAEGKLVDFRPTGNKSYRIVLFWATWCPYCKALMPHLEAFRAKTVNVEGAIPIEFLALNVWEDGNPQAYLSDSGFNFRLIPNADEVAKEYGVKGTPGLFLVNNRNEVLYKRRSGTEPAQVITDIEFILENLASASN